LVLEGVCPPGECLHQEGIALSHGEKRKKGMKFAQVEEAIDEIKAGRFVIIVDDEDRENEGDLAIAAEKITPEAVNFMCVHARGLICLPATRERLEQLNIPLMVNKNTSNFSTAFTVSVDAKQGVTTGISAHDRAKTIKTFIDPTTKPEDLACPGHIFPLLAKDGGVLMRAGHTEAIVDLTRLSGLHPAGVICEIMNDDGSMAKLPQLQEMAKKYGIKMLSIADLIGYRCHHEKLAHRVVETKLPTKYGDFTAIAYKSEVYAGEHVALVKGNICAQEPVLVRIHSECITGDVFDSMRCDCGSQLARAMKKITDEGRGVLVYMRSKRSSIDSNNRLPSNNPQNQETNAPEICPFNEKTSLCDYDIAAKILLDLGVNKVRLITNNHKRAGYLENCGVKVDEIVPIFISANLHNQIGLEATACS